MIFQKSTNELEKHIKELHKRVKCITERDNVYKPLKVSFFNEIPQKFEGEYCYSDSVGYHYCFSERGELGIHKITDDLFEISYWILETSLFEMAENYEANNRIQGQDFRRLLFKKILEYFAAIGDNYKKMCEIKFDEILKNAPFDDSKDK